MNKQDKIRSFDPNGVAVKNGHFIGLPFTEEEARIVFLPVPWDVTVSSADGAASGPENILECSYQLDLLDPDLADAWQYGHWFAPVDQVIAGKSSELRKLARKYISYLEDPAAATDPAEMERIRETIDREGQQLNEWVYEHTTSYLRQGKLVGLVGGDHSTPLGYYRALGDHHGDFGLLVIDAHLDLRQAYEGFTYSHASVFYNALQITRLQKLVQVGIRDYCESERKLATELYPRTEVFYDHELRRMCYEGATWQQICREIIAALPARVAVSVDIDGLDARYCPHTGTPVPGGLEFQEMFYLLRELVASGREIIGFDLCEVAGNGHEWDGNVGARVLYKLSNMALAASGNTRSN